jgi:acyl-CoA dehydrogenase
MTDADGRADSMVADAVRRLLADARPSADGFDAALWSRLAATGVHRLLRPEGQGGAGRAFADACAAFDEVGAHAPDVPLVDAVLGHALLAAAGIEADDRPIRLSVPDPEGATDPADRAAVPGVARPVHRLRVDPWGGRAACHWADADGTARSFELDDADAVRGLLAVSAAAVLAGAMRRALDLSLDWAGTRVQFGRPIGRQQAVQHMLAQAAEVLAASQAVVRWAAVELESGAAAVAPPMAKVRAAEAAGQLAAVAHQVHGAIGFTAEHPLCLSSGVLWLWRDRWGNERYWARRIGALAFAAGPDGLYDLVCGDLPGAAPRAAGADRSDTAERVFSDGPAGPGRAGRA